jgi:hypothetical protein
VIGRPKRKRAGREGGGAEDEYDSGDEVTGMIAPGTAKDAELHKGKLGFGNPDLRIKAQLHTCQILKN